MANTLMAQKIISGKVYNEKTKLPLEGVTVQLKNGTSTHTDSLGYFMLRYNGVNPVLLLSSIGYFSKEVTTGTDKKVFFLRPRVLEMAEVTVSNGYQQLSKERATGSFDKIDNTLLNRATGSNILDRLDGVTSSLYFSKVLGTSDLFIRGLSTINGNTTPLIILNNFPYDGDINNINPNDVENITVLKDAAASSIWGAQAGNGVIVINTKKGKYSLPAKLSFSSTITVQQKQDVYKDRAFINSNDFINLEKYLFSQGFYDGDLADVYSYPVISPVVEILSQERDGTISSADADAQINALSKNDVRQDYEKYLYRKAATQQYSIGLSGGSDKINFLVNAGFDKNQATIIGNDNRRNTLFTAINLRPLRHLEINTSFTYTDSKSVQDGMGSVSPGYTKSNIYPYAKLADSAGNHLPIVRDYRYGYIDTTGQGLLLDWQYRPLDDINDQSITTISQDALVNLGLKYTIIKDLSIEVKGQYEKTNSQNRNYYQHLILPS